jgi:hypothetical protein
MFIYGKYMEIQADSMLCDICDVGLSFAAVYFYLQ